MIDSFGGAMESLVTAISKLWSALEPIYNLLMSALGPILGVIAEELGGLLLTAIINIAVSLKEVFDFLSVLFDEFGNGVAIIGDFANNLITVVPESFQTAWNEVVLIWSGLGQWFNDRSKQLGIILSMYSKALGNGSRIDGMMLSMHFQM